MDFFNNRRCIPDDDVNGGNVAKEPYKKDDGVNYMESAYVPMWKVGLARIPASGRVYPAGLVHQRIRLFSTVPPGKLL